MISPDEKAQFQRIADMDAWNIAKEYGCHYSGDCSPIPHGGFFYDARDWEKYGYASIVEFWCDDDSREDTLIVECRTVNRPDDMESAFRCIGIEPGNPLRNDVHCQIEAVQSYQGSEPLEDFSGPFVKRFKLADWPHEWRIWRSIDGWIRSLGN